MISKNSNYAAAESYLTFQHNEYTGLPILDEKGRPKLALNTNSAITFQESFVCFQ